MHARQLPPTGSKICPGISEGCVCQKAQVIQVNSTNIDSTKPDAGTAIRVVDGACAGGTRSLGVMAWALDGQQEVHDLWSTEACSPNACAALRGGNWGVRTTNCRLMRTVTADAY